MNALANWLGITDPNAPRDYDNEANRAGFWDTVRQMSAIALAAGARQSDASRAQILGQLANVSGPSAGATRYAQANMQNMQAQRQREQYAADQNFSKGLDAMPGLSDNQRAILRAMGPGAREAYTNHAMNTAFEDPTAKLMRLAQMQNMTQQAELHRMQADQIRREIQNDTSFDRQIGYGSPAGPSSPQPGMPAGAPPALPAAAGGIPSSAAQNLTGMMQPNTTWTTEARDPQMAMREMQAAGAPASAHVGAGLTNEEMLRLRQMGMKRGDILKKQADAIADQAKPPAGYMWVDDARSGVRPIPGSDKEQIPVETGARIAAAERYLTNLPQIRAAVQGGGMEGFANRAQLAAGLGAPTELWRQVKQGMEAIVRLNTGAGQSGLEFIENAKMYEPSSTDSKEQLLSKMANLEAILKDSITAVRQGRGPSRGSTEATPFLFDANKRAAERGGVAPQQAQQPAQRGAAQLQPGTVDSGFVYVGGNPASQSSWRPISQGYSR